MHSTLAQLGGLSFGAMLVVACIDGTAPVYGTGCSSEPQSQVHLEGDTLVTQLYVTRDYRRTDIISNTARTTHYRTCQRYRCTAVREDPSIPVTDAEATAALAACRAEADVAWATRDP
jgi:hypothetical protein